MSSHNKQPILTLRYTQPPPHPHPAVTEPTPDKAREARRQQEKQSREIARAAQASEKKSIFDKAGNLASEVAAKLSTGVASGEDKARELHTKHMADTWAKNFPHLASDKYIFGCECMVMHRGIMVIGEASITTKHLCFVSSELIEAIPLSTIASIQMSVALPTVHPSKSFLKIDAQPPAGPITQHVATDPNIETPPYFMIIPAPNVQPNALQVFSTNNDQLFQFLNFDKNIVDKLSSTKAINVFYNYLDHAWRDATTVPLPNQKYC